MDPSALLSPEAVLTLQSELNSRLLKLTNKAVVFADGPFVEWFNLTVGLEELVRTGGALNLKEFDSFQSGGSGGIKAVFFVGQALQGAVVDTLKDILSSSQFQVVFIVTSVHPTSFGETDDYFDTLKDNCLIWMKDVNFTCEIHCENFPFAFMPVKPASESNALLFLSPLNGSQSSTENFNQLVGIETYQRLVKLDEMHAMSSGGSTSTNTSDFFQPYYNCLGPVEQKELTSLCHSLNEMLEQLDAKDDCFSLGVLSALVSNELNKSAATKQRRKSGRNKVSLLLIDRNLDLSMGSLYHDETVFDKITNMMPGLSQTSNDVRIDLQKFLFDNKYQSILPGSFFHHSKDTCKSLISQFMTTKPKECLLDVYRKLNEVLPPSDSAKEKKVLKVNADTIRNQIKSGFKSNQNAFIESADVLQIIIAYCQINDPKWPRCQEFDKLSGFAKVLTQNMLDKDGPSVLSRLYALFSEEFERNDKSLNYMPSDLIILLIYVYSLVGEECYYGVEEEQRIKKLLVNELESDSFNHDARFKVDLDFFNKIKKSQNYSQFVDKFFQNLRRLKPFRKTLKSYNKLIQREGEEFPFSYKPLIKLVCENLLRTAKNQSEPLLDIEYRTANAGNEGLGWVKSFAFGWSNSSAKIHPLNNEMLIVYFVGGVTTYEYKIVKELFRNEDKTVLIGSSHFYNHNRLMRYVLA